MNKNITRPLLRDLRGMIVISGYPCDLYDVELFPDWQRVQRDAYADGASRRTEVLWLSPKTTEALSSEAIQPVLFEEAL